MQPRKVDIIIPIHNRWSHTKQTLDSLVKNTDPNLFNLYLINDGSTDAFSEELCHYILRDLGIVDNEYFSNPIAIGPGASRNWVAKHITDEKRRSEFIYHSDNDVFFTPGWLGILLGMFEIARKHRVELLGGGCHPYLQNNKRIDHPTEPLIGIGIKDAVSGYSQLMTWETWDKYGPFDESMRNAERKIMGSEDWAFCQKIINDGFLVGSIEPEVVIATGKHNTYGDLATGHETFKEVEGVNIE